MTPQELDQLEQDLDRALTVLGRDIADARAQARKLAAEVRRMQPLTTPVVEEPMGLGAVILDVNGNAWVRMVDHLPGDRVWRREGTTQGVIREWARINVATVAHPGVAVEDIEDHCNHAHPDAPGASR